MLIDYDAWAYGPKNLAIDGSGDDGLMRNASFDGMANDDVYDGLTMIAHDLAALTYYYDPYIQCWIFDLAPHVHGDTLRAGCEIDVVLAAHSRGRVYAQASLAVPSRLPLFRLAWVRALAFFVHFGTTHRLLLLTFCWCNVVTKQSWQTGLVTTNIFPLILLIYRLSRSLFMSLWSLRSGLTLARSVWASFFLYLWCWHTITGICGVRTADELKERKKGEQKFPRR